MAAETLFADNWNTKAPAWGAGLHRAYWSRASATHLGEDGDILRCLRVPKQARILGWGLYTGDLDSGTAVVLDYYLYETVDETTKLLLDNSTLGQAGGLATQEDAAAAEVAASLGFDIDSNYWEVRVETITSATGEQAAAQRGWIDYVFP